MNREERLEQDGYGDEDPILFYGPEDEFGCFSNFSFHPVTLPHPFTGEPVKYRTGEHRFQAMKAIDATSHDYVRKSTGPFQAKKRGGPGSIGIVLRPDWGNDYHDLCYYVMFEVVLAKTLQNSEVQDRLGDTMNGAAWQAPIYEDSPTDDIWGWRFRNDYRGKNLLGRCWMEVRELLF